MKIKLKFLQIILIIVISSLAGYYIGINEVKLGWKNYKPSLQVTNKEAPASLNNIDFSLFWNVWRRLESTYYDKTKLDAQKMLNGAITGMTQSLDDPYTIYLPPKQNTNFKDGLAGQFEGIGAELGVKDKQIIVIAPLAGSPAEKAGIKAEDAILKVDNETTVDWTLPLAVEKIRGKKRTEVVLTIKHKNSNAPEDIKIIRDTITVKSVDGWIKRIREIESIKGAKSIKGKEDREIAYIRLSQFGDATNTEWISLVNKFSSQMKGDKNIKGMILDLRNNPGGYLTDAVYISSEFLKKGTPVVLQENAQGARAALSVEREGSMHDVPLVVVLNKGSASASEIVGGALRDNKRAVLVGETSFGKGTIQDASDLGNGAGLHITVAKWLTPNGVWVHSKGLTPDIEVKLDEKDPSRDTQLEKAVLELIK